MRNIYIQIMVTFLLLVIHVAPGYTKNAETLAILPFEIHSEKDAPYIKSGILNMLYSRLYWKDHVTLIHKNDVKNKLAPINHLPENELVLKLGNNDWTDYVLTGSITEYANAFSIDVKIYDIKNASYLTFFDQTSGIEQVIKKVDIISAKINKKLFDRETITYEKLKQEEVISEEELKRMNPEKMMPYRKMKNPEEKPWWKFW